MAPAFPDDYFKRLIAASRKTVTSVPLCRKIHIAEHGIYLIFISRRSDHLLRRHRDLIQPAGDQRLALCPALCPVQHSGELRADGVAHQIFQLLIFSCITVGNHMKTNHLFRDSLLQLQPPQI